MNLKVLEPQRWFMGKRPSFIEMAVAEPFRIFFPLGMAWGIIGVSLWPLYYSGISILYPMMSHIRLMTQGFLGCFIFGFLLTAMPRLLGSARPSATSVSIFFTLCLLNSSLTLMALHNWADFLFLAQLLTLASILTYSWANRSDLPPPGFVLALAGLVSGMVGAALMWHSAAGNGTAGTYLIAKTLLFQAFPIFPVIGIGAFFFPKLTGSKNPQDLPTSMIASDKWKWAALKALAVAVIYWLTMYLEVIHWNSTAYSLRAAVLIVYLVSETPVFKTIRHAGNQQIHLRIICLSIIAALVGTAVQPSLHIAWLHLLFIIALTGVILIVSARVVFGHTGRYHLAHASRVPLLVGMAALTVAAFFRIAAEFFTDAKPLQLNVAAAIWISVAAAWFVTVGSKTSIPEPSDDQEE